MARVLRGPAFALLSVLVLATGAGAASGDCRLIRGAATPDDPTDDVRVCEQATFFHRSGSGLANLNAVPSFNSTAPTASDAVAYATVLGRQLSTSDTRYRPTFQGTFTGNLDTLRVDEFLTSPVYQNVGGTYPLLFDLTIDGTVIVNENPAAGSEQEIPLNATSEDGIYKMSFAVKNLYQAMEVNGLNVGDSVQHTVRISMTALYYGDGNSVHWFDSATRPSGIYFNPNKVAGNVYDATAYA
jgi:hypothetical protein